MLYYSQIDSIIAMDNLKPRHFYLLEISKIIYVLRSDWKATAEVNRESFGNGWTQRHRSKAMFYARYSSGFPFLNVLFHADDAREIRFVLRIVMDQFKYLKNCNRILFPYCNLYIFNK